MYGVREDRSNITGLKVGPEEGAEKGVEEGVEEVEQLEGLGLEDGLEERQHLSPIPHTSPEPWR